MSAEDFICMCWLNFSFMVSFLTLLAWIYLHLLTRLYCINLNVHIILYIGFLSYLWEELLPFCIQVCACECH